MNIFSALDTQNIIASNKVASEAMSSAEKAREDAEKEKIDFLNLLLTQLENQNPLDPMDTDEWTAQLTRYSILEQGIETNANLAITNEFLKGNSTSAALSYIGKEVELETNTGVVQNGEANWAYLVEGDPSEVFLTVATQDGTRLAEIEGSIANGVQPVSFNAADFGLSDGQPLYLSVNATDRDGNKLNSTVSSMVKVDGAWSDEDDTFLTAGEVSFRTSDVRKIADRQEDDVVVNTAADSQN